VARITRSKSVPIQRDQPGRLTLSEEFELIRIEAQTLFPEDRLSMMPKVEEEVLEAIMTRVVKDLFDPLTGQIEELTQKFEDLQTADNPSPRNRPRINLSLPLRPLVPFSGGFGESVKEFTDKLKHSMVLQGVSEEDDTFACAYLESFLSGAALVFYKQRKTSRNAPANFAAWIDLVLEAFPEGRDSDVHQMLIYDRKQRACETVTEYEAELKRLATLAYSDLSTGSRDNIIRPIFLRGLLPEIRDVLKFKEFSNLVDALKAAKFIESQLFRDNMNNVTRNMKVDSAPAGEVQRQALKRLILETMEEIKSKKACFTCGSVYHLKRACPKRRRNVSWSNSVNNNAKRDVRQNRGFQRAPTPYRPAKMRPNLIPEQQQRSGNYFRLQPNYNGQNRPEYNRRKVNCIMSQSQSDNNDQIYDFNNDLIAHIFTIDTVAINYEIISPPAQEEQSWDEKEIAKITNMMCGNAIDDEAVMKEFFGPLDSWFTDGDIELIDLEADDLPGPSNQGKKIDTEHTENFSKSPLRNKVETSCWPRRPCKNSNRDSAFLSKVKLFLSAFLIVFFLGTSKAVGEIFNDCHERQQGFLLEIPKVVSCKPHMSDEVPYPVNITMWIPRRRPVPLVAYRCYKEIRKTCTETSLTWVKSYLIAQNRCL